MMGVVRFDGVATPVTQDSATARPANAAKPHENAPLLHKTFKSVAPPPRPADRKPAEPNAVFSARHVLAGSLRRWNGIVGDSVHAAHRINPAAKVTSIAEVTSFLHLKNAATPTVTSSGLILVSAPGPSATNTSIVAARIATGGKLEAHKPVEIAGVTPHPPVLIDERTVLAASSTSLTLCSIDMDDRIAMKSVTSLSQAHGVIAAPLLTPDGFIVVSKGGALFSFRVRDPFELEECGALPLPSSYTMEGAPFQLANGVIVSLSEDTSTGKTRLSLTRIDHNGELAEVAHHLIAKESVVFPARGNFIVIREKGSPTTIFEVSERGMLAPTDTVDDPASLDNAIIGPDGIGVAGTSHGWFSFRFSDQGKATHFVSLDIDSAHRPILTRDRLLITANAGPFGEVKTHTIDADGHAKEGETQTWLAPTGRLAATADGHVLVCGDKLWLIGPKP